MVQSAAQIWRDYETDGVASSLKHNPGKAAIRAWGTWLESLIAAGLISDAVWKSSKALLEADLAHDADTMGIVYSDATAANNGLYIKNGASGAGSWTQQTTFLPGYQFVTAGDDGNSTANAMTLDTVPRLPSGDGVALITIVTPVTNTSPDVTVSFDGGTPLAVKTAAGDDPAIGGLVAGMTIMGVVSGDGTIFRMTSDQTSAAIQAACEVAQAAAEAAAGLTINATGVVDFDTAADLAADNTIIGYSAKQVDVVEGDVIKAGGYRYAVAASGAADHHLVTAGGVKLYTLAARKEPQMFGGTGQAHCAAAITAAGVGGTVHFPPADYTLTDALAPLDNQAWSGDRQHSKLIQTGTNKRIVNASGIDRLTFSNLFFQGNNDDTHGLFFDDVDHLTIHHCWFDGIGDKAEDSCCIFGSQVRRASITYNRFFEENRSTTGSDVALALGCSRALVHGNHSNSKNDAFCNLSTISYDDGVDTIRHIVTGNTLERTDEACRSAILAVYGAAPGRVVVSGNTIEGWCWNGVYVAASADEPTSLASGGVTVTANQIRHCGGGKAGDGTAGQGLSASIFISGLAGAAVSANQIEFSGLKADGTTRNYAAYGVRVNQNTQGVVITANTLRGDGYGSIYAQSQSWDMTDLTIAHNIVLGCLGNGIEVASIGSENPVRRVSIHGNQVRLAGDASGIRLSASGGGFLEDIIVSENMVTTTADTPTSAHGGIYATALTSGQFDRNRVDGFVYGIRTTATVDRVIGDDVLIRANYTANATNGYFLTTGGTIALVYDPVFGPGVTAKTGDAAEYIATQIGTNAAGEILVRVSNGSAPPGTWRVGDEWKYLTPVANGTKGGVQTTTGWKNEATLAA